ncbi:MAG: serine hydrolase domain-containing protein, partial [Sediminibacterium sp.]
MKIISLALIFNFLTFTAANSQMLPVNKKAKLDSLFAVIDKNDKGMGGVSIFRDGKEIYSNHYGFLSVKDGIKATNETKYRIGSMSKMFTAVIILKQVEKKKLSLNSKLSEFFPKLKNADKITIEMLLKHRSGLANFTDTPDYDSWKSSSLSQQDLLDKIASLQNNFNPNEKFEYSNTNFLLLSLIAQ